MKNTAARLTVHMENWRRDNPYAGQSEEEYNALLQDEKERFFANEKNRLSKTPAARSPAFLGQWEQMKTAAETPLRDYAAIQSDQWRLQRERVNFENNLRGYAEILPPDKALEAGNNAITLAVSQGLLDPQGESEARRNYEKTIYAKALSGAVELAQNANDVERYVKSAGTVFEGLLPKAQSPVYDQNGKETGETVERRWTFTGREEMEQLTIKAATEAIQQRYFIQASTANAEREQDIKDYRTRVNAGDATGAATLLQKIMSGQYGGKTWDTWRRDIDANQGGNYAGDKLPQLNGMFDQFLPNESGTDKGKAPNVPNLLSLLLEAQRTGSLPMTLQEGKANVIDLIWDGRKAGYLFGLTDEEKLYFGNDKEAFVRKHFDDLYEPFIGKAQKIIDEAHGDPASTKALEALVKQYKNLKPAEAWVMTQGMQDYVFSVTAENRTAAKLAEEAKQIADTINGMKVANIFNPKEQVSIKDIENYGNPGTMDKLLGRDGRSEKDRIKAMGALASIPRSVNTDVKGDEYYLTSGIEEGAKRLIEDQKKDLIAAGYAASPLELVEHFSADDGETEPDRKHEVGGQIYYTVAGTGKQIRQVVKDGKIVTQERDGSVNGKPGPWQDTPEIAGAQGNRKLHLDEMDERDRERAAKGTAAIKDYAASIKDGNNPLTGQPLDFDYKKKAPPMPGETESEYRQRSQAWNRIGDGNKLQAWAAYFLRQERER